MFEELDRAIEKYRTEWQKLVENAHDKDFFLQPKPTSVGWKVEDLADFDTRFAALRDHAEQIHFGWVNERWIVTLYMKKPLPWGLRAVKLMQRRPGSTDAIGLDHVDFLIPKNVDAKLKLQAEPNLEWSEEKNGAHCKWLSVWFAGSEAKLRSDTVLQVCANEMLEYQEKLLEQL